MNRRSADASLLAELLLAGPLTESSVQERVSTLLGPAAHNPSLQRLLSAIVARYEGQWPPPVHVELTRFIGEHRWYERVPKRIWPAGVTRCDLPRPEMLPLLGDEHLAGVPSLTTAGELAEWLQVSHGRLHSMAGRFARGRCGVDPRRCHYRYRWRLKSSGRWRLLEIPKPRLMGALRRIHRAILSHVPVHDASHAFRAERSIYSAVLPHCGRAVVIHLDVRDFFTAIPSSRVFMVFRLLGYPERVARLLTGLCTNRVAGDVLEEKLHEAEAMTIRKRLAADHLPQGAPTSPVLSNLCSYRLDRRLCGLARQFDAHYTRYADDLIFSGGRALLQSHSRFLTWVNTILLDEGFSLHVRKTRVMPASQRQQVCGLILNERPNISRRRFERLKAVLRNCATHGPQHENRSGHPHFRDHLQGQIAWVSQINPQKGARLQSIFEQIDWSTSD